MKLALVSTGSIQDCFPPAGGGIEVLEYYLLDELRKRKHKVQLFSSSSSIADSVSLGFWPFPNHRLYQFTSALNCFRKRKKLEAEAVHCHHPLTAQAFLGKKPLVFTEHNWYNLPGMDFYRTPFTRVFDFAQKRVYGKADAIIALSPEIKLVLEKNSAVKSRIEFIPNYTDSREFVSGKKNPKRVLFVGRLAKEKGLDYLFEALAELSGYELQLIGSGSEEKRLKEKARLLGINASFLGQVPHNQLHKYFAGAGIFVLPSFFEVMPVVVLEAMSSECACVAFDAFGIPAQIDSGKNGFVVSKGNTAALREKLSLLLEKPVLQKKFGAKAREKVLKEFDVPVVAGKLEKLYSEIIK